MRRTFITLILALGALGCSDSITPPSGPSAPTSLQADVISQAADIRAQINALVPDGGPRTAALALFDNVERAWTAAPQRTQPARQQAAALCKMIQKLDEQHKLLAAPAPTTVGTLCSALNSFVAGVSGDDAVAQFVPANATEPIIVIVPSYKAGVKIPPGAFGQDVTVIITKIDGIKPLAADPSRQYPYFFEFQTIPVVPHFAQNVIVGVCTDESVSHPAARLRLAHNVTVGTSTQLEVLAPVFADFLNSCQPPVGSFGSLFEPLRQDDVLSSPRQFFAASAKVARDVGARVVKEAGPREAFASNISLGGASGSFSPFGGYDIGIGSSSAFIDFETYPATAAAGPTPTCARCIVTNEYQSQGVVFSWESTLWPAPANGATLTSNSVYNDAAASPPNHVVTWSLSGSGVGQSGTVRMTFSGVPSVVEYDRTVPQSGTPITIVTDGAGSTNGATTTVTPLGTFTSIGGFTFAREHVRIVATQGIANIALDMNGTGQTIDNLALNPASITNLAVAPTSIQLGGSSTWTADLVNPGAGRAGVILQGYLSQAGGVEEAAGGTSATCPGVGDLASGTCAQSSAVVTSALLTGTRALTAGPATFRLEMRQGSTLLDSKSVPVTLTNPPGPVITSLSLLPGTSLQIGGAAFNYTATVYNPGAPRSVVFIQGEIQQGNALKGANGTDVTCSTSVGLLPTGNCIVPWNTVASNTAAGTGTLVPGAATFILHLYEFNGQTTTELDVKSVPITLTP